MTTCHFRHSFLSSYLTKKTGVLMLQMIQDVLQKYSETMKFSPSLKNIWTELLFFSFFFIKKVYAYYFSQKKAALVAAGELNMNLCFLNFIVTCHSRTKSNYDTVPLTRLSEITKAYFLFTWWQQSNYCISFRRLPKLEKKNNDMYMYRSTWILSCRNINFEHILPHKFSE